MKRPTELWLKRAPGPRLLWFERLSGRRPSGDRGAVAIIAAVLLGSGLLFGVGAIVIDSGQLYNEREQLLSGADAASWYMAQNCAATPTSCGTTAQLGQISDVANGNSKDGLSAASLCSNTVSSFSACAANTKLSGCQGPVPTVNYVEAHTTTKGSSGSTVVRPAFAGILSNNSGTTVGACSRVAWGSPAVATVLGIAISSCEWAGVTGSGSSLLYGTVNSVTALVNALVGGLGTALGNTLGTSPAPAGTQSILLHGTTTLVGGLLRTRTSTACTAATPAGYTAPGGFGYLAGVNTTTCQQSVTIGTTILASDLFIPPQACFYNALVSAVAASSPIIVPIYDGESRTGLVDLSAYKVHISGFAAFVFTSFQLSIVAGLLNTVGSLLTGGTTPCLAVDDCIQGYFVRVNVPAGSASVSSFGTSNYGVQLISRVG